MLLIVINHKKPQDQQPSEETAHNPYDGMNVPDCPGQRGEEQERRRE